MRIRSGNVLPGSRAQAMMFGGFRAAFVCRAIGLLPGAGTFVRFALGERSVKPGKATEHAVQRGAYASRGTVGTPPRFLVKV